MMKGVRCCKVAVAAAAIAISTVATSGATTTQRPEASGTSPAATVDARLRFLSVIDAKGRARLEAAYEEYSAKTMRRQRDVFSACFCALYLGTMAMFVAMGTWASVDYAYGIVVLVCLANIGLPRGTPAWARTLGTSVTSCAIVLIMDLQNAVWDPSRGEWFVFFVMLYALSPTLCGALLRPPLKWQAFMCTVHAVRAIALLSPLGALPVLVVCASCVLGTLVVYMQEWHSREHFVSAMCSKTCAYCL